MPGSPQLIWSWDNLLCYAVSLRLPYHPVHKLNFVNGCLLWIQEQLQHWPWLQAVKERFPEWCVQIQSSKVKIIVGLYQFVWHTIYCALHISETVCTPICGSYWSTFLSYVLQIPDSSFGNEIVNFPLIDGNILMWKRKNLREPAAPWKFPSSHTWLLVCS